MPWYRVNGLMVHLNFGGRQKRAPAPCCVPIELDGKRVHCMGISTALCDWPLATGKTCDRPLCEQHGHAHPTKSDTDYCPDHWAAYRESEPALF
jgi:hypothetical protein